MWLFEKRKIKEIKGVEMSTCLGLYIEENIIKYAKVTKERDQVKIDAFGVKFY